jgi:hypothetical protein
MAFVPVPKDLTKVKTKVVFGLTKRQLICFGTAAVVGVPVYLLTRGVIGNSAAVIVMIIVMLPAFFVAIYEKDGMPAERILRNILRARWFFPPKRPYKTENFYQIIEQEGKIFDGQNQKTVAAGKAPASKHQSGAEK